MWSNLLLSSIYDSHEKCMRGFQLHLVSDKCIFSCTLINYNKGKFTAPGNSVFCLKISICIIQSFHSAEKKAVRIFTLKKINKLTSNMHSKYQAVTSKINNKANLSKQYIFSSTLNNFQNYGTGFRVCCVFLCFELTGQ